MPRSSGWTVAGVSFKKAAVGTAWVAGFASLIALGLHGVALPDWLASMQGPVSAAALAVGALLFALNVPENIHTILNIAWLQRAAEKNPELRDALVYFHSVLPLEIPLSTAGARAMAFHRLTREQLALLRRRLLAAA